MEGMSTLLCLILGGSLYFSGINFVFLRDRNQTYAKITASIIMTTNMVTLIAIKAFLKELLVASVTVESFFCTH